jgi:hypothetical protein
MLKKRREAYQQKKTKEPDQTTEKCKREEKEEKLKKRREAYQRKKTESEQRGDGKEEMLKKRREAYQQKITMEPEQRTKRCAQDKQRYANMQPEKKKARLEQVAANKVLKRGMPCKESIAMRNPAYNTTEYEGRASTLNVRQKKGDTRRETNIATSPKRRILNKKEKNWLGIITGRHIHDKQ